MSKNPPMFQIRAMWLSLYKAHRLCAWVATHTSPAKPHARSIRNSPEQTATNTACSPHVARTLVFEETKSGRLRRYTSSRLKSNGNWENNKGFINSITSNRKCSRVPALNRCLLQFFPYFPASGWKKKKKRGKQNLMSSPFPMVFLLTSTYVSEKSQLSPEVTWYGLISWPEFFKLDAITIQMGQKSQKVQL